MANFAIKDAMDLKITKAGESSPMMTIDFLNGCSFERNTSNVFAKKYSFSIIQACVRLFYQLLLVSFH